ncbi:MAG: NlpC/P60 family protein [Mangrovibacterium sp.]
MKKNNFFRGAIFSLLFCFGCAETKPQSEEQLGNSTLALVCHSVVPMRAAAGDANEMVSQATMGTPIRLLAKQGNWYRVQSPDGYFGWMENNVIRTMTDEEMEIWCSTGVRYVYKSAVGWIYSINDEKSQVVCDLVEGCIFQAKPFDNKFLQTTLPDGRIGFVQAQDCELFSNWGNQAIDEIDAQAIIADAMRLLGVPYLWGGSSTKAVDCSGFTQLAFKSQGILLERDASQQQQYGERINASDLGNLRPGDLLFFGKTQRATHVGIYLGDSRFIHASGMVKINSLDPIQPDYNEKRHRTLIEARRILQAKEGKAVKRVKESYELVSPLDSCN